MCSMPLWEGRKKKEKKKGAKPRMTERSATDWISLEILWIGLPLWKRKIYNFVKIRYISGRCPSIRHSPLGFVQR